MLRLITVFSGTESTYKSKLWELAATTVIGLIAWLLGRIYERRKTRFKDALAACKRLRTLLAEWFDGIRGAVELEKTVDDTLEKLAAFMERHHFEERTRDDFHNCLTGARLPEIGRIRARFQEYRSRTEENFTHGTGKGRVFKSVRTIQGASDRGTSACLR